ncbi:MAG: hypothetical protein JXB00_15720, partial [Bacteroidales bacterium]|nr:hypothetical protein [Bacteroidales bacterium]
MNENILRHHFYPKRYEKVFNRVMKKLLRKVTRSMFNPENSWNFQTINKYYQFWLFKNPKIEYL